MKKKNAKNFFKFLKRHKIVANYFYNTLKYDLRFPKHLSDFDNNILLNVSLIINLSFLWRDTKEGCDFWSKLWKDTLKYDNGR